jgi:pimeloyl-ACP methyl ester carboxylesterase
VTRQRAIPVGDDAPTLRGGAPGRHAPRGIVLVLHGGRDHSEEPTTAHQLAYLRMVDMYLGLHRRSHRCAVYLLRFRVRGWNAGANGRAMPDPVADAHTALDLLTARHPGIPVALLGHSMGGRTACAVAGRAEVVGVCALAPWLPEHEPLPSDVSGTRFVLAHGVADTMTSPVGSLRYAERLRAAGGTVMRFAQPGGRHALLDRPWLWHRLAVSATLGLVGATPLPSVIAAAFEDSAPQSLHVPLDALLRP